MKKWLALLLVLALSLSLCACGGGSGGTQPDPAPSGAADGQEEGKDPEQTQPIDTGATYLSYEDLTMTQNAWIWLDEGDIWLQYDYPGDFRFEDHGHGIGSEDSFYYSMLLVHAEQPMPDTSLEDAFYALLNDEDGFRAIERMVFTATYDEVTPDEMEHVTLDCGREAIKFSGTQRVDDYSTVADRPIQGYCTMLDDIPVIACYIIFNEEGLEEDRVAESARYCSPEDMEHYITEMINTVRIVEE